MRSRITLNTFRKLTRIEESMLRATMPRISANDATPLVPHFAAEPLVLGRDRSRLVRPLTATIEEVVNA